MNSPATVRKAQAEAEREPAGDPQSQAKESLIRNLQPGTQNGPQEDSCETAVLCGSLCTTADVLVREVHVSDVRPGDHLVFGKCGAYSATEPGVLFLLRDMPYIYLMEQGFPCLIRGSLPSWRLV